MNQITKLKPVPRWETLPVDRYPIINQQGTDYQLVPLSLIEKLRSDKESLIWFAVGLSALTIASIVAVVAGAFKPATQIITVEKPVIVTQEKVVSTNCLIFCK